MGSCGVGWLSSDKDIPWDNKGAVRSHGIAAIPWDRKHPRDRWGSIGQGGCRDIGVCCGIREV